MEKKRSRKIYVLWGIALTLLVTAGLACWLVVVPFVHARRAVLEFKNNWDQYSGVAWPPPRMIGELGGPQRAASCLSLYLHAPDRLAPDKYAALDLLTRCGEPAIPVVEKLLEHLKHRDGNLRGAAGLALAKIRGQQESHALEKTLTKIEERLDAQDARHFDGHSVDNLDGAKVLGMLTTARFKERWRERLEKHGDRAVVDFHDRGHFLIVLDKKGDIWEFSVTLCD